MPATVTHPDATKVSDALVFSTDARVHSPRQDGAAALTRKFMPRRGREAGPVYRQYGILNTPLIWRSCPRKPTQAGAILILAGTD